MLFIFRSSFNTSSKISFSLSYYFYQLGLSLGIVSCLLCVIFATSILLFRYDLLYELKILLLSRFPFKLYILPKAKEGVKFLITNEWDDKLAKELQKRGFRVFKITRRSARSVKEELDAVNYGFKESPARETEASKGVHPVYDTPDAGRGFEETGRGISKKLDIHSYGDASISKGKVEGAGDSGLPDEIRDRGRGRGG